VEFLSAGWREEARRELSEHRALRRQSQEQINENARQIAEVNAALLRFEEEGRTQMSEIRKEMAERDAKMDERIAAMVSASTKLSKRRA
jgi:hypothetical protein